MKITRSRSIEYIRDISELSTLVGPDLSVNRQRIMTNILSRAYPIRRPAKKLMEAMGLNWQEQPISSFVSLCIIFQNINQGLRIYGWQAMRTDGTPEAFFWLSPVGVG